MNTSTLTNLITAMEAMTQTNSISPAYVGNILREVATLLDRLQDETQARQNAKDRLISQTYSDVYSFTIKNETTNEVMLGILKNGKLYMPEEGLAQSLAQDSKTTPVSQYAVKAALVRFFRQLGADEDFITEFFSTES